MHLQRRLAVNHFACIRQFCSTLLYWNFGRLILVPEGQGWVVPREKEAFVQFVVRKECNATYEAHGSASFFQRHVNSPIESTQA